MTVSSMEHPAYHITDDTAHGRRVDREKLPYSSGFVSMTVEDERIETLARNVLIQGPALDALDLLPDASIQSVVTSPPYWSLRDYDVNLQTGCDEPLKEYITDIMLTFRKLRRVLKKDGAVWLNVGDAFTSGNRRYRAPDKKNRVRAMSMRPPTPDGLKPKDLIGLPWRIAFALQEDGWWLRSEVIWNKPNAHPESVQDRPTKAHETIFLLSNSKDYYYNIDAVRGPNGRRLRTTWDIPTEPRKRQDGSLDVHPAIMPSTLAKRCVEITSRVEDFVLDPYAGSGTTLIAAQDLKRQWVGIELKPAYIDLMQRRLKC